MIKLHNFYLDIVYGLYKYIVDIVPVDFYGLETNLGNAGLQLTEDTNFRLPRIQIDLSDINVDLVRPVIFQHYHKDIVGQQTAIHNMSNDIIVDVQEEYTTVSVEIRINCDDHLQALDIKHYLNYALPINKPLNHFGFTSFFKLPDYLITKGLINPDNDYVVNLYQKHYKTSDSREYCFGLAFEPLMRPNSINLDLSDNNASSFVITISAELNVHIPTHIIFPWLSNETKEDPEIEQIRKSNIQLYNYKSNVNRQIILKNIKTGELKLEIIDDYLINTDYEWWFGRLTGDYLDSVFECEFKYLDEIENEFVDGRISANLVNNELLNGYIKGEMIDGKLYNIIKSDNLITGFFDGNLNSKKISKTISVLYEGNRIRRQFINVGTVNSDWHIKNTFDYVPGNILYNLGDVNRYRMRLNTLILKEYNGEILTPPISVCNGIFEDYNLKIDMENSNLISCDTNFNNAVFDIIFDSYENFGIGYINTIKFDINNTSSNIISGIIDTNSDNSGGYNNIYYELNSKFIPETREFEISFFTNYNPDKLEWTIFIPKYEFRTTNNENKLKISKDTLIGNRLKFLVPEQIYMTYFSNVSRINPLFLVVKR